MKFKKGDLLVTRNYPAPKPMARVVKVTRDGIVHCVNLIECSTMAADDEFQFDQKVNQFYVPHGVAASAGKKTSPSRVRKFKKGDLLTSRWNRTPEPLARVTNVKEGIVYCINLIASSMTKEGGEFQFTQESNSYYTLHSRK